VQAACAFRQVDDIAALSIRRLATAEDTATARRTLPRADRYHGESRKFGLSQLY